MGTLLLASEMSVPIPRNRTVWSFVRGFAGSAPPFLGRERAAVSVDVDPERRGPRYHETCLALESVEESSAAVSKPRCVWLRVPIVKNLNEARRLPVRV